MSISYPLNYDEKTRIYSEEDKLDIKLRYNREYEGKKKSLESKAKNDFKKILDKNHHHAIIHSTFLRSIIQEKTMKPYDELSNFVLLIIDPLYTNQKIKNLPTFDSLIGYVEGNEIKSLIFIEVKTSKEVDSEYKKYKKYFSDEIRNEIRDLLMKKYPHLKIDSDNSNIDLAVIVESKHKGNWINSFEDTKESVFLLAKETKNERTTFKLEWCPPGLSNKCLKEIETFFLKHPQRNDYGFQMSYSLDNLYNLDYVLNQYRHQINSKIINEIDLKVFLADKIKENYLEEPGLIENLYKQLLKLGAEYNVIYQDKIGGPYKMRKSDILVKNFIQKRLDKDLLDNESTKQELLQNILDNY